MSDSTSYYLSLKKLLAFFIHVQFPSWKNLQRPGRKFSEVLENFQDVLVQDKTIVRVHSALADRFPAQEKDQ